MLIITRRAGERIMLGDDVRIEIMEVVGSSVRVGVEAPRSVPIYREEIWSAVKEENQAAAAVESTKLPASNSEAICSKNCVPPMTSGCRRWPADCWSSTFASSTPNTSPLTTRY